MFIPSIIRFSSGLREDRMWTRYNYCFNKIENGNAIDQRNFGPRSMVSSRKFADYASGYKLYTSKISHNKYQCFSIEFSMY